MISFKQYISEAKQPEMKISTSVDGKKQKIDVVLWEPTKPKDATDLVGIRHLGDLLTNSNEKSTWNKTGEVVYLFRSMNGAHRMWVSKDLKNMYHD